MVTAHEDASPPIARFSDLKRTSHRPQSTVRVTAAHGSAQGQGPGPSLWLDYAGSWPVEQAFSWRRLSFGDAFQPAARAGGHARASELRKVRGR
eukprot:4187695-Prymnesium_polylepis.1